MAQMKPSSSLATATAALPLGFPRPRRRRNLKQNKVLEYVQLAHNYRDREKGRSYVKVLFNFGRADQLDTDALRRLVRSVSRYLEPSEGGVSGSAWARSCPSSSSGPGSLAAPGSSTGCGSGSASRRSSRIFSPGEATPLPWSDSSSPWWRTGPWPRHRSSPWSLGWPRTHSSTVCPRWRSTSSTGPWTSS